MSRKRIIIGVLIWLLAATALAIWIGRDIGDSQRGTLEQVSSFLFRSRQSIELEFASPEPLYVGDAIFERQATGFRRIGEIVETTPWGEGLEPLTRRARAVIYSSAEPVSTEAHCIYYPASQSMGWVIQSMLTAEKRERIGRLISEAYRQHHLELARYFEPIIQQALREGAVIIWEDLIRLLGEHSQQLHEMGERYQVELVNNRLLPLFREVIWPAVVKKTTPLVVGIGEEIWQQTSLWRFGWRYMYDLSPLPQRDLTKSEFENFVRTTAAPIIEKRLPLLIDAQQQVLAEVANDPRVRAVVLESLRQIGDDQQMRELAISILRDVLVNNRRLIAVITDIWESPQAKQALNLTNQRLEYTITSIGAELFGDPHVAITPEFSRVLRYKVLRKDYHWFLIQRGSPNAPRATTLKVDVAAASTENPFHIPAEKRN